MNNAAIEEKRPLVEETVGTLDHARPGEQMEAVHAALQRYFEAEDWLAERNKRFPGLFRTWRGEEEV